MGPEVLSKLLKNLPSVEDKNLIVGFEKSDDAAIYKLTDEIALIQTLDFFTPMTEDPYIFGQIAAANSLSDVYAMGGEPKTAMNIVCFPEKENIEILGEILRGGAEKIAEAGAVLSGGHSIHDPEVKYGLSVTGLIHPDKVFKNYGSKEGDVLIITKPLGTGIISTASKVEIIPEEIKKEWIKIMTTLNKYSAEIIKDYSVSACTDITGFGFLGHAYEMAVASEKTFVLEQELIPYLEIAKTFAKEFYINSMGQKNRNYLNDKVDISSVPFWLQEILLDPQTSGGLLFSLPSNEASEVMDKLNALDIKSSLIGTVDKYNGKYIVVR
ncbi:MAG: selenide, water dikinase SelD [Cetobacterium sp.]